MPPVSTLPSSAGTLRTDFRMISFTWTAVREGWCVHTMQTTPETMGAENEVPLLNW